MITVYIVLLIVCIILSAFFSSSETAFISLQKGKLQHEVNTNVKGAARVLKIIQKPEKLLSTVILGNNLVQNAAVSLATGIALSLVRDIDTAILFATIGSTILIIIFGESTPKSIGAHNAHKLSRIYARPIEWISWLFSPFVFILSSISVFFNRLSGQKSIPRSLASEEEIRAMISVGEKEGEVEKAEAEMLHNVFEFTDRPVRELMVPRPDVVFVECGATIKDFMPIYSQTPLSRYPVFEENRDNVIGILAIKYVLMALAAEQVNPDTKIDKLVRPTYFTPETKPIGQLFREMRDKNYHLCVVVDEHGGTAGIVTIDMLVEQVVGPVGDELSSREKDFEVIDASTFEIDGSMRLEEIKEEMGLELPEGDYETIAGFILYSLGRIPKENEQLRYKDMKLVIKKMDANKIDRILLTKDGHATTSN